MVSKKLKAQMQFLTWLDKNHPDLYDAVVGKIMAREVSGQFGQIVGPPAPETESLWSKITSGLLAVGTTYLTLKNQRDAMKLNLARAEQGLPPIDPGITAPVIRTEIDLPPEVIDKLTSTAGLQINKILLFGGAALAFFFIMK
jgi:hypothetical protein